MDEIEFFMIFVKEEDSESEDFENVNEEIDELMKLLSDDFIGWIIDNDQKKYKLNSEIRYENYFYRLKRILVKIKFNEKVY